MLHLGAARGQLERVFRCKRRVVHPDYRPAALLETENARLLEENITDADDLLRYIERHGQNGEAYSAKLLTQNDEEIVIRTIEGKTGLATTHPGWQAS